MANVMINSEVAGTQQYGALFVGPGPNTFTAAQFAELKKDKGFLKMFEKNRYKELGAKELKNDSAVKKLKQEHADEIDKLKLSLKDAKVSAKTELDAALKARDKTNQAALQSMVEEKALYVEEVKTLTAENKALKAQLAG